MDGCAVDVRLGPGGRRHGGGTADLPLGRSVRTGGRRLPDEFRRVGGKGIVVEPAALLYELRLERLRDATVFRLHVEDDAAYAVFLEHPPRRYGREGSLFLTDFSGQAVPPRAEIDYR